jgi:hypothetical protein
MTDFCPRGKLGNAILNGSFLDLVLGIAMEA